MSAQNHEQLLASLSKREASYDPVVKMQFGPIAKTYHTALKKDSYPYVHETYLSIVYALDLLDSKLPEYTERGSQILSVILQLQDTDQDSSTYGIWPYYYEEPLDRMETPDWNYADFIGKKLVLVLKRHGNRLNGVLRQELSEAIGRACQAIVKRDVGPSYTNIAAMGAFVTLVGGEVIRQETFVEYGRNRLQRLFDYTLQLGTFVEFNSPCYTPITIEELHHIHEETKDPVSVMLTERLLYIAWKMVAEHYHPRTKEWAGPHSRSYSPMLNRGSLEYALLRNVLENDPESQGIRCPEELLPYFNTEEERSFRCPIFDEEERGYQSYATTYMNEAYCLGSFSKDMMWNQRRNLIAYLDNHGKAAYVQLRFLKDGRDFSSAVFTGVQDRSDIIFGINMALDFGDWHPVLDPVNGVFEAKDIRIRIEIGGYLEGVHHLLSNKLDYDAAVVIGGQTVRVKQLSAFSDMELPRITITRSEQDGTLGIDYIIYEGPRKEFDFHQWNQAAWAFMFTLSARADELQTGSDYNAGSLYAWCEKQGRRMGITIPVKPDCIQQLFRNNKVSFMAEDVKPHFRYSPQPVLKPVLGCEWASKMVLNPAIVKDPISDKLHMLFRATGPWSRKRKEGKHDPFPIFLGYAVSNDLGKTWDADFSRPALAPALNERFEDIYITDIHGNRVRDYSNGCIEDPRIFPVEGELYVSVACRMFPPGPYWLIDQEPSIDTRNDYVPEWVHEGGDAFSVAARTNNTVTVLYKLDLDMLKTGRYEEAFIYVCPLTEGHVSDNRDAFLFPDKMRIDGKMQYVMLHRPMTPALFPQGTQVKKPSIYLAAAEKLEDFATDRVTHRLLATSQFHWEDNRIGASWAPLKISADEWLVSYHGKKDAHFGYTQSFLIVREQDNDFPVVAHRCSERLMYPQQEWEMPSEYPTPCLFTTGGIVAGDDLIMSYGAADQKVGISWVNFAVLVGYVKQFDAEGRKM